MNTRIVRMKLGRLKLLEVNARYMRHETYQRLVENIRRDGRLTSVPLVALWKVYSPDDPVQRDEDGNPIYEVLSGNHRVRAAIDAGIEEADVMAIDAPLPEQQRIALQLSHNALVGEDDPATLKLLYDRLADVDWRAYSGLDDKTLKLLESVSVQGFSEQNLDWTSLGIVFLPEEMELAKRCMEEAKAEIAAHDHTWLARMAEYDSFMDALALASSSYNIANTATALLLVLSIFQRHLCDLAEGFCDENHEAKHSGWVPMAALFGRDTMPARAAVIVKKALEKMQAEGDLKQGNLWQALEYWAADYLAGA